MCPLVTPYGHILLLLQKHESLKRSDLADMLGFSENYISRMVAELHADGLITTELLAGRRRWRIANGVNVTERLTNDGEA